MSGFRFIDKFKKPQPRQRDLLAVARLSRRNPRRLLRSDETPLTAATRQSTSSMHTQRTRARRGPKEACRSAQAEDTDPDHTEDAEGFKDVFENVTILDDDERSS